MPSTFVKVLALVAAAATVPALAAAQNTPANMPGNQTFGRYCAGCHGSDGHGSDKAPSIATMPEVISLSDAQLVGIVTRGTQSGMPPFGFLGEQNVRGVVAYLRNLQGVAPSPATAGGSAPAAGGQRAGGGRGRGNGGGAAPAMASEPITGDPASGKSLFFSSKAQCSNCHAVDGQGGVMGPDMTIYARTHQPSAIRRSILEPGAAPANAGGRRGGGGFGGGAQPSKAAEVELKSGQHLTGVVRGEDNLSVVLLTQDGRYHFLDRANIAKETTLKTLMPASYSSTLTAGEINDIIAYLAESAKQAPVEPAEAPAAGRRRGGGF